MGIPYIGEIRMFGGNFPPVGWAFCNGQTLAIAANDALFSVIGTTYGGDGVQTFALPDLRGRVPIHQSTGYPIGQVGGVESVTLGQAELPAHAHVLLGSNAETESTNPSNALFATSADSQFYAPFNPSKATTMSASALQSAGGSQAHDNMQPYLCVSFIIALEGIFPQQG